MSPLTDSDQARARSIVERTIPFRFLSPAARSELVGAAEFRSFEAGERIIAQGGEDREVYLLASGQVEVYDDSGTTEVHRNFIEPEHYFGEWEPLFDVTRTYSIRATRHSICLVVSGDLFLRLVETEAAFAQSFAVILREQQGVFAAFDRFKVELMRGLGQGYLTIAKLVPLYRALCPAIHPLVNRPEIDTSALAYVIRRLPTNVTRTFAYLLTDEMPAAYRETSLLFTLVPTSARRRDVYEMLPGGSLVLLRNGISDLVDLISCLCLYAVEARKIRNRFADGESVRLLAECAGTQHAPDEPPSGATHGLPETLPFSAEERQGLSRVWGETTAERILEIVKHRETFAVTIRRHSERYSSRRTELWTKQLAEACHSVVGIDPSELPESVPVHIISSNTHSIVNCLNDFYSSRQERMIRWARESGHEIGPEGWHESFDYLYAIARDYFIAHPDEASTSVLLEEEQGIHRLSETASTGIQVQLIDMNRVCRSAIDPGVSAGRSGQPGLIVNIDYAFGEQAEHILRNLLLLFGKNVRSVNLLGKAGALAGKRGDLLVPTAFLEQSGDELYEMSGSYLSGLETDNKTLAGRLPGSTVHTGAMLTVDGTLLQNRDMLRFYRHIWSCVGMEMEGAYYYRQFREARSTGLIGEASVARFYYYVSDIPLEHSANLSARLLPHEGVPPLYAITRQVLSAMFG